jgi:hypothetical protein
MTTPIRTVDDPEELLNRMHGCIMSALRVFHATGDAMAALNQLGFVQSRLKRLREVP